jgi:hypothetical protein
LTTAQHAENAHIHLHHASVISKSCSQPLTIKLFADADMLIQVLTL